jgi:hypothetical protein
MNDYMRAKERTATARAKFEAASNMLERRIIEERMAELISQHDPVNTIGIDRDKLSAALYYAKTGRLPKEAGDE